MQSLNIVIAGAGSVGCFVGGLLAHAGRPVTLFGRGRIATRVQSDGLQISDPDGLSISLTPAQANMTTDPACLAQANVILVCVKSVGTADMAKTIAQHASSSAIIVSLQNGVTNADALRAHLPAHDVRAGMFGFNVVQLPDGTFHRGTSGEVVIGSGDPAIAPHLNVPGLGVLESPDIAGVQWGKLLMNLNNALNALSNIPLRDQLADRQWRRVLADQMDEALAAMAAAGITPKPATPMPPKLVPHLLRLPTWLFRLIAGRMMKIDPEARSSMWEDLQRGRKTEIDSLQGAIVALARAHGMQAPINASTIACIKAVEGKPPPTLRPADIDPRYT